jgi:hypothetical protein
MAILFLILTGLVTAPSVYSQQNNGSEQPSQADSELLTIILSRMEQAQLSNREHARPYTLTREYKVFDDESKAQAPGQKPSSEVIANVEFVPPDHKSFRIEKAEGSERGKTIVRHILENESAAPGKGPVPLTQKYYEFKLVGEDTINGQPCWVLSVKPHHDEKNMIKGKAWVDKDTYLTQRIQGEMAKTPSWWLKKVEMTIRYGDAAGMWMPTGTYVVADVRFFGKHVLTSQALKVETTDQVAESFPATPPRHVTDARNASRRFRPLPPALGAGVYVPIR